MSSHFNVTSPHARARLSPRQFHPNSVQRHVCRTDCIAVGRTCARHLAGSPRVAIRQIPFFVLERRNTPFVRQPPRRPHQTGPPGLAHDSPRIPNVHISGPRRFKHHRNSTQGPPRERRKKENCGGRGKKKTRNFGPPTLWGPTLAPPFGAPPFEAPPFGAPPFLGLGSHPSGPHPSGRHFF